MFTIFEVADEFLTIASMSQKKLQKLCYYAQGLYGALTGEKLFKEELEAWIHGPVSPLLYNVYKVYGYWDIPKKELKNENQELKEITEQIYRIYGNLDGDQLEYLTHQESPWRNARGNLEPYEPSNEIISFEEMKKYFKEKLLLEETNV